MDHQDKADKYIARDGGPPARSETLATRADISALARGGGTFTLPFADYKILLQCAEMDSDIVWCEVCDAWLHLSEPECCSADGFTGCWKAATGAGLCVSYRSTKGLIEVKR
jgi:hypothetical protein